ncbi:MAG: SIR2 family protein [Candidatus Bathyarchaeia archaeon]
MKGYALSEYPPKISLRDKLKDLIRHVGIVKANDIRYFEPLLGFLEENKPLDIFSVNYDISIEQFCNAYKIEYVDGFDLYWNVNSFNRTDVDIRLYKVHGSILWYKTDRGYYVKLPTRIEGSKTELITGEQAVSLILYPMRKWDYAEPLLEMLLRMKNKLETASFVIAIGYSFRDDNIRRIFWDAARKNKKLVLILISPSSAEVYEKRLRDYQIPEIDHSFSSDFEPSAFDASFHSALAGRVICLPHKFEDVLPFLKKLLEQLRNGLAYEQEKKESEYQGKESGPSWGPIIRTYLDCAYMTKVEELAGKVNWQGGDYENNLTNCFKAVLSYIALGNQNESRAWLKRLDSYLDSFSIDKLFAETIPETPPIFKIRIVFGSSDRFSVSIKNLFRILGEIIEYCGMKMKVVQPDRASRIRDIKARLEALYAHIMPLQDDFYPDFYARLYKPVFGDDFEWVPVKSRSPEDERGGLAMQRASPEQLKDKILENERRELEKVFGGVKLNINV